MKVSQRTPPVCLISKRFFETSENIKMNKIPRILCLLKFYQWVIFIGFPIQISRPLNSVGSGHPRGPPYRRSLSSSRLFEKCFSFTKFLLEDFFFADENHVPQSDNLCMICSSPVYLFVEEPGGSLLPSLGLLSSTDTISRLKLRTKPATRSVWQSKQIASRVNILMSKRIFSPVIKPLRR